MGCKQNTTKNSVRIPKNAFQKGISYFIYYTLMGIRRFIVCADFATAPETATRGEIHQKKQYSGARERF
jgi:hypothetical protein